MYNKYLNLVKQFRLAQVIYACNSVNLTGNCYATFELVDQQIANYNLN